jgi:hypothetical protein
MENIEISESLELTFQISKLKAEKTNREVELKQSFNELTQHIFLPDSIRNEGINEINDTKRGFLNLSKMVVNRTTNYILEQKFGVKSSFKYFLGSMFLELLATPFITKKITTIFSQIHNQGFEK